MEQFNEKSQFTNNVISPEAMEEEEELFLTHVIQNDPELFFIDACLHEILCKNKKESEQFA